MEFIRMSDGEIDHIEEIIRIKQAKLGALADTDIFDMLYDLLTETRLAKAETEKAVASNRHYLFHFFDGDVLKAAETFAYMMD